MAIRAFKHTFSFQTTNELTPQQAKWLYAELTNSVKEAETYETMDLGRVGKFTMQTNTGMTHTNDKDF